MKKVYVLIDASMETNEYAGLPICAYASREAAEANLAARKAAMTKLQERYDSHGTVTTGGSCNKPDERYKYRSSDGYYYETKEAAGIASWHHEYRNSAEYKELMDAWGGYYYHLYIQELDLT